MAGKKPNLLQSGMNNSNTKGQVFKTQDFAKSAIFCDLDSDTVDTAFTGGNLYYSLNFAYIPEDLISDSVFSESCIITATSKTTKEGKEFVAMVEHTKYPFFGFQFHPEKTQFERLGPNQIRRDAKVTRFVQELITTVVDRVRIYDKPLSEIDPVVRGYFEVYHTPQRGWEDFEQVYVFQQLSLPVQIASGKFVDCLEN